MKINEFGRSMIEMLGVLAIIGVLSVGGIAGYSKAMQKYRVNKAIDEITTIVTGVQRAYVNERGGELGKYESLNPNLLKNLGIIPENEEIFDCEELDGYIGSSLGMGNDDKFMCLRNEFAGGISIGNNGWNNDLFALDIVNLPKDICIALASIDWTNFSGFVGILANSLFDGDAGPIFDCLANPNSEESKYIYEPEGRVGYCAKEGPLPVNIAAIGCNCTEENNCEIILGFE